MSEAIAFDTHRFVKRLTESGFSERQAETLAEEYLVLLNSNLATKTDILEVKATISEVEANLQTNISKVGANLQTTISKVGANLQTKIEALRQETKFEIERMKSDLLKWMLGALIVQGGLIVALIKLI